MQLFNPLSKSDIKFAASFDHPAVFACIMRRGGLHGQLDCHGFVCENKEDAILIASNLYKSLMETMRKQQQQEADKDQSAPAQKPSTPQRPPRQRRKKQILKRSSEDSSQTEDQWAEADDLGKVKRSHSEKFLADIPRGKPRRTISERRSFDDSDVPSMRHRSKAGDIYTKVAMPRSKSFMNVSGPYNLQELFKELKEKEGIESIDDILRQVITPDGMSYN